MCATIRVATMRCMDLHSLWKVYVRTPLGFRSISVNSRPFCKGTPKNFIGFLWTCVPLGFPWICVDFARLPCGTSLDFLRFMARQKHVWMQRPWINVARGMTSNILPIAMRPGAQLAARGAHNPQVTDSRISPRRIHDAELYWRAELFICNWLLGLVA